MEPQKFGRYEITEEVDQRGTSTIYRAYDPLFEREVSLKILRRDLFDDSRVRQRFEREAKIIALLEHAAIVPVYDIGRDDDQLFFVMRYMEGGSLAQRIQKRAIPISEVTRIIQRVAAALDYAHYKGIVHRNCKPGNILFDEYNNAYISDFGLAKFAHAAMEPTSSGIVGTPTYMSPEQARGEEVDGRSDIYSLGVILFEMLSGKIPFEARTTFEMILKHANDPVPDILKINPNLPGSIGKVIEKALAKNPAERFQTAMELATALNASLQDSVDSESVSDEYFDVYISYNIHNREEAVELATQLRETGRNVWIDMWMLKPEDDWAVIARNALQHTHYVLILMGPRGIGPRGQTEELEIISSTPQVNVIPVLLPNSSPDLLPTPFKRHIYSDFRAGITNPEALTSLLSTISGGRRKPIKPPDYPSTQPRSTERLIKVKLGDTLSQIAIQYDVTVAEILRLNPQITNPNFIRDGEDLRIPDKGTWEDTKVHTREETPSPTEAKPSEKAAETTENSKDEKTVAIRDISVGGDVQGSIVVGHGNVIGDHSIIEMRDAHGAIINLREEKNQVSRRLLNAGFMSSEGIVASKQALASDQDYDLLVDIGPEWSTIPSIVAQDEKAYFPEERLPANEQGYVVRAVFVSEDFSPHLSTAELWVPAKAGQSYPYINGERTETPGPVKLLLHTPSLRWWQRVGRAYGRLCLYYKGQLIQSAQVSVGIAQKSGMQLKEPNKIEVDYVLTSNFTEVNKRVGDRRVKFVMSEEGQPISVNLTLNDDGSGRHRILATYHVNSHEETTVPPAWAPYDADSSRKELEKFRKVIKSCYKGLDEKTFSKSRKSFGYDMQQLAVLGDRLRSLAMGDLDVSATGRTVALWRRELLNALKLGTVIQIARTGPANYVFPWAIVYQYPLPGPEFKYCPVIEEWSADGIRTKKPEMACPYDDEPWHQQNIICPYGFWGLKHIIEQPPAAIHEKDGAWHFEVTDKIIGLRNASTIGTAVTYDIDKMDWGYHIDSLSRSMNAQLEPLIPAHDRSSVLAMLRAPEIVYFLCHGETDPDLTPYLSIGEHINRTDNKIYPNTLEQWSEISSGGLDLEMWQLKRPLVFINGCHTAELQPGVVLNFISAFTDLGASGVIGTEVSVKANMAMIIAEEILSRVAIGMEVGQACREMRWEMANRGNLLGLAYTPYSLANLHVERML